MTTPTATMTLPDGMRIVVPDSLEAITPYVLREQGDWFEDEIRFVRKLLQPGEHAIDIGANYGVYTLAMARAVGSTGRVIAYEPASATADLLVQSIEANGLANVALIRAAMSNRSGTGRLAIGAHAELNALVDASHASNGGEEIVSLVRLDDTLGDTTAAPITFVKLDAEGEELNIIAGGTRFFATHDPLVQFEVRAGEQLNLGLIESFRKLGYSTYRLVPGLQALAPVSPDANVDDYLLNLFCCKADRAAQLAKRGLLIDARSTAPALMLSHAWSSALAVLPYAQPFVERWRQALTAEPNAELEQGLARYAQSRDTSLSIGARHHALTAALGHLSAVCTQEAGRLRLATLARIAHELGARSLAVHALSQLADFIAQHQHVETGEPFLLPMARYESIVPRDPFGNWILAAILESIERLERHSSFFGPDASERRLEAIRAIGFADESLWPRLTVLEERRRRRGY